MKKLTIEINFLDESFGDKVSPMVRDSIKGTLGKVQSLARDKLKIDYKEEK